MDLRKGCGWRDVCGLRDMWKAESTGLGASSNVHNENGGGECEDEAPLLLAQAPGRLKCCLPR